MQHQNAPAPAPAPATALELLTVENLLRTIRRELTASRPTVTPEAIDAAVELLASIRSDCSVYRL
jgi:hypothetical protein